MSKKAINELEMYKRVLNCIPTGEENAVQLIDLCGYVGLSKRKLKEVITDLREDYPICAKETNGGGYWISTDAREIKRFISMIESHKAGYDKTIRKMQKFI